MDIFNAIGSLFLLSFGGMVLSVFFMQRARFRRRMRREGKSQGFYPRTASLGNALHHLQAIAEPQVRYVIQQKLDEHEEEDDESGAKNPTAHLKRQLRKIRNGEDLSELTVFKKNPSESNPGGEESHTSTKQLPEAEQKE